jgi:VIT1/CCC1 family predicted Fe2+/Mn2+ transporter
MEEKQTPGADEMYCPSCGAVIKREAEICMKCGVRVRRPPVVREAGERTAKPVIGGVLGVISGLGPLIAGIVLMAAGTAARLPWEAVEWAPVGGGIILFILGTVAIVGSSFAIARRNFVLSIIGGVCAMFSPLWFLGVPALILIALSSREFITPEES